MTRDVEGRETEEKIKRQFGNLTARLKSLLGRIKAADRLIDQIVYRLYELTEEEIAVVEGSCTHATLPQVPNLREG